MIERKAAQRHKPAKPAPQPSPDQQLTDYIRRISERDRIGPENFPIRPATPSPDLASEEAAPHASYTARARHTHPGPALTERAAESYARILRGHAPSAADTQRLRVIVLPALRPAFDIVGETYALLPEPWGVWNTQRAAASPLLRGVGRLQFTRGARTTLVGTSFVCGPDAILTNRHVAELFVQGSGAQLSFLPGITPALETLAEVGSQASLPLPLSSPIAISTRWDAALLRVGSLPAGIAPLPLASNPPSDLNGGDAVIIGYPAHDPDQSRQEQDAIFRGIYDRKRFQPGKLTGRSSVPSLGSTVSALAHDCSTLGGNSGSALLSAASLTVVGLHFSGVTHVANYAVPTWELLADPAFAGQHLNFA